MSVEVLAKVKGYFESALLHPTYQAWLKEAKESWSFYEGKQWTKAEEDALAEKGQPAIVINKISPKIDNLSGAEVAGRTRIIYRSRSGDEQEEKQARQVSDIALYVSEKSSQDVEVSKLFKSGLVTGIGWLDVGVEGAEEGPRVFNKVENELDVVWDPSARADDYSDASFIARQRWLNESQFSSLFPQHKALFNDSGLFTQSQLQQGFLDTHKEVTYLNSEEDRLRIVEVQYKQTERQYSVILKTGEIFSTFDKKQTLIEGAEVKSQFVPRVYVAYYVGDVLLSHKPLNYDHGLFTLLPYYFKRERATGQPFGLVRTAMDPQKELNKRRSKAMHLLNTAQVIADIDAVDDPNVLAREAARPDGIILKRPGKDLRIMRNSELASSQVSVMEKAAHDIQEVMGVFDEAMGQRTNAVSGTAIRVRQQASSLNQMFAYDALRRSKKILGSMLISLIRQFFDNNMIVQITDQLQPKDQLQVQTLTGERLTMTDLRKRHFDVHVEEVKDVQSSRELELAQLETLIQAGVPVPPEMLVEATNLQDKDKLLEYLKNTNKQGV